VTNSLTFRKLALVAAVATLGAVSFGDVSTADAQGFRIGVGGGGWSPGRSPSFGRGPGSVGRQIQGMTRGLSSPYSSGGRRSGGYPPSAGVSVQRAPQAHPVSEPVAHSAEDPLQQLILKARREFKNKNYQAARKEMDQVVQLAPKNQDARQFRSLILFAMADYQEAAAEAYDAFLMGPAWTWETLRSLYSSAGVYTEQFRGLQKAAKDRPDSLETQFLLAYHYLMLGHLQHGEAQLLKVLELRPEEPVSQQLLAAVRAAQNGSETPAARN
jgi:Tfp pilus assembly protein PilF